MQRLKFPEGFLWGAATAAHQVEGNNTSSDWWAWEHSKKRAKQLIKQGKNPEDYYSGIACDSYNRFDEDFALAQSLHHNAHRLSIEWARIEPQEGAFDEKQFEHYEKVLQAAKFHGLATFVTLHHFTNPKWFADKGGFQRPQNNQYFIRYVKAVVKRLDQYTDYWLVINEPEELANLLYWVGVFPPQKKNLFSAARVALNLAALYQQSAKELRLITAKPISMAFDIHDLEPADHHLGRLAVWAHRKINRFIFERTVGDCDFIGLNYYFHHHIGLFGRQRKHSHSHHTVSDLGWGIHPEGLESVLRSLKKYRKPIYITENGIADHTDEKREKFIKDHLYYIHKAIHEGCDVRGYLYWSLIDNFEWAEGFGPRFGLVEIDRANNLQRKIRQSALVYAEICGNNFLEY